MRNQEVKTYTIAISALLLLIVSSTFAFNRDTIVVGGEWNYPPYEFINEHGLPDGFNVDLSEAIAKELGIPITIKLEPWNAIRSSLDSGKIDIVQGVFLSEERLKQYIFSPPHNSISHVIAYNKEAQSIENIEGLQNKSVAVMQGDIMHDLLLEKNIECELLFAKDQEEALRFIDRNMSDYALVAKNPALYFIKENKLKNILLSEKPLSSIDYCYASIYENEQLILQISDALYALHEKGIYSELQKKWFTQREDLIKKHKKDIFIFFAIFFTLFSLIVIWISTLRHQVSSKTRELSRRLKERKKIQKDLIAALLKAEESDKLKSTFLATMSHELRTPLNSVIGFSEIIDKETPMDKVLEYCKIIYKSGNLLLSIVDDLIDISLIEAGQLKLKRKKVSLSDLFDDINRMTVFEKHKINKPHLKTTNDLKAEYQNLAIYTDPVKLQQVFINLIKNAIKFTEKGSISYGVKKLDTEKNTILFYVKDTGIGISPANHENIFDIFKQVEDSATKKYAGTGLGLSISRKIVTALGGKIWVESSKGSGSTFLFEIKMYD